MIKVTCRSNDDDLRRLKWPCEFAVRPEKDDRVEAECGRIAVVCGITHTMVNNYPILEVKLRPIRFGRG